MENLADLSKLQQILINAKKINDKIINEDYSKGNFNTTINNEELIITPKNETVSLEKIANSKLPEAIKQSFIQKPTAEMLTPTELLTEEAINKINKKASNTKNIKNETLSNITKDELRSMIQEEVINVISKYFVKYLNETLQENIIKKLIKEGKIKK